jgi:Ca-activated chloride channel family protein
VTPANYQLVQPQWLWLFPALLAVALGWSRHARHNTYPDFPAAFSDPGKPFRHPLIDLASPVSGGARHSVWTALSNWIALACLILALAQPVRVGEKLPDPPKARDIVFIVDTSVSMTLRDYVLGGERIDRMRLLKVLLDQLIRELPNDRIGVIVFADTAHTLVPLSPDHNLVRGMLSRVTTGIAGRSNAVGDAIALAVKEAGEISNRRRILILFSDAALPTGVITPEDAAELAADAALPLYTVAVGATSYAAQEQRFAGLIYHPANVELLEALAERTGANNYRMGDADALRDAVRDISHRERDTTAAQTRFHREALYHWPLIAALALLFLVRVRSVVGRRTR